MSTVCAYVGYDRLETQAHALEALYEQRWVYYNLCQPVPHLVAKEVVDGRLQWLGYGPPYQRLLETTVLSQADQERLAAPSLRRRAVMSEVQSQVSAPPR